MQLFIRQAIIADPRSGFDGQTVDLLIENGKIKQAGANIQAGDAPEINIPGLHVSPGWIDIFANFCDPGLEFKETLESGSEAAAAGGYTRVLVVPNTKPVVDTKSQVEYLVQKSKELPVTILPIGAITKNGEGKDLAEMYDLYASGAIAFSDGWNPLQNSQVMLKALQYVKAFNGVVIQVPDEQSITKQGLINEGIVSTQMGLPGKPAIGEYLMVARDLELLRYTGSRLHVTGISTAASIELIKTAKAEGLDVTCSVTPYHLHFTDEDLKQYDTNLKVNPPLRTRADVEALRQAVLDGTVDCISSHHQPHDYDNKVCEFEYAKYGMEGIESCFAAVKTAIPALTANKIVALFSLNPAAIFNLSLPVIAEGQAADLTLFVPGGNFEFTKAHIRSLSINNAFVGQTLTGFAAGMVHKQQFFLNDQIVETWKQK